MKRIMKQLVKTVSLSFLAISVVLQFFCFSPQAEEALPIAEGAPAMSDLGVEEGSLKLNCKSAILMEATTGSILYLQNAEEAMPPASVTKIMTLLLIMEAIDEEQIRLSDTVTVSAYAASMGGSQVFLKEG